MSGILLLAAYAAFMFLITALATKRTRDALAFHVADRKMGTAQSSLSIALTWVWAPSLFVSAERAYTQGVTGLFWFLVPNVLCLMLFIPFAKRIRRQMPQGITLSGFIGERYGLGAKRVYLFQLSALSVFSTGVNLLAGSYILAMITGLPFSLMTVIMASTAFSFTQFSGIRASVATDVVQIIYTIGICFLFAALAMRGTGLTSLVVGFSGSGGQFGNLFSKTGLDVFLAFGLPAAVGLISGPFGDQNFWQRAFAVRKEKIGRAFFAGALIFGTIPLSIGILGLLAGGTGFTPCNTGIVSYEFIRHTFPAWSTVPFMFLLVSGLVSTVTSNICATASLTTDITDSKNILIPKAAMLLNLALGVATANIPGITITGLFLFYGTLRASTFAPTVLSLSGRRIGWVAQGVVASLALGLPLFAWGTIADVAGLRIAGSLTALLTSGFVALTGGRYARKKT